MFNSPFVKRLTLFLLFMAVEVAYLDTGTPMTAVRALPPASRLPARPHETWDDYQNEFYAYKISYPLEAQIEARGVDTVTSERLPANLTADEYQAQVEALYPDNICLSIVYQQGFVTVLAPLANGGQFVGICGLGGLGVYEIIEQTEDVLIDGQLYPTMGMELWLQKESPPFQGGFFSVTLTDGTAITYGVPTDLLATASGGQPEDLAYEDYLVLMETLRQIVASYRSTGRADWPLLPAVEPSDVALPVASWIMPEAGPVPGTPFSYSLSTGKEYHSLSDGDFQSPELANATFAAGSPVTIHVDSTAITAFRAQIADGPQTGGRGVYSLPAEGQMNGDNVIFTLAQRGYSENQFLRVRLDFTVPVSGYVEYAWQLIPTAESAPMAPTPVASSEAPPTCTVPTDPLPVTATLASDPAWAQILQETAPEMLASQADLIIFGTVDTTSLARRSWLTSFTFGPTLGIVTDTVVHPTCTLRGTPSSRSIRVRTEGGCLGSDEMGSNTCMAVSHGAQLMPGTEVILFLQASGPEYVTMRRVDGHYTIQTVPETSRIIAEDGMYVIDGDQAMATPRHTYSLAELLLRIATAVP